MNKTHRAVVDTMLNNLHGIPTDTPMFEKNGWTGDAALGAEMFMLNFDVHELFAKWLRDVHETREDNGRPLVIAPSSGDWGEWGIAPPWHSAYVLIPEWLDQYGGDRRVLTELYDGMKQYVDLEFDTAGGRDRRQRAPGRLGEPGGQPRRRQRARGPARLGHRVPVHDAAEHGAQRARARPRRRRGALRRARRDGQGRVQRALPRQRRRLLPRLRRPRLPPDAQRARGRVRPRARRRDHAARRSTASPPTCTPRATRSTPACSARSTCCRC